MNQVDMKDVTEPIKSLNLVNELAMESFSDIKLSIKLAPNEFTSNEDYVGLFGSDPESYNYFS